MERLNPRVRLVWMAGAFIRGVIAAGIVGGGAFLFFLTDAGESVPETLVWAVLALVLISIPVRVAVAWRRYAVWRFELRGESLYIERGVFTRIKTVVPYVRVQHVDSRRAPLERALGLATVVVYTAGSRSADVAIPGLPPERAEELREELRGLAIESDGADAV